ncbi:hypothetical protein [Stenomitos frigidus]|nr:hypothetical protein [Stenomitos frigidus]
MPKSERRRPTRKGAAESSGALQPLVLATPTNGKVSEPVNGNGKALVLS